MSNKWIDVASPQVPAATIAVDALRVRVQYVQQLLPLAAHEFKKDIEHVHQLRVACRRADATLKAFRPLLRKQGRCRSLQKWLRRIRRAAGPARDLDVLLMRLKGAQNDDSNRAHLIARLEQQRSAVQRRLVNVEAKAKSGKLERSLERCLVSFVEGKKTNANLTFGQFARASFKKAGRPIRRLAGTLDPTLEQLHRLRIASKRLRYSIEFFHSAFDSQLRTDLYPLVEKLQTRLGRINDHVTAQAFFRQLLLDMPMDSRAAYLARCIVEQQESAEQLREEFLDWWSPRRIASFESMLMTMSH
ncbi:MAG: CHAD domain-containing protein [Planctomycetales bacterium]|nr:CHAD domain-containing protein [Planctomycetales bacterium]